MTFLWQGDGGRRLAEYLTVQRFEAVFKNERGVKACGGRMSKNRMLTSSCVKEDKERGWVGKYPCSDEVLATVILAKKPSSSMDYRGSRLSFWQSFLTVFYAVIARCPGITLNCWTEFWWAGACECPSNQNCALIYLMKFRLEKKY